MKVLWPCCLFEPSILAFCLVYPTLVGAAEGKTEISCEQWQLLQVWSCGGSCLVYEEWGEEDKTGVNPLREESRTEQSKCLSLIFPSDDCLREAQVGNGESFLLDWSSHTGLIPELQRSEAQPHGLSMQQDEPSLGRAKLWEDTTKPGKVDGIPTSLFYSPAQFNVESWFSSSVKENLWKSEDSSFSSTFPFSSDFFLFVLDSTSWSVFFALEINTHIHDHSIVLGSLRMPVTGGHPWTKLQDSGSLPTVSPWTGAGSSFENLDNACSCRDPWVSLSILGLTDRNKTGKARCSLVYSAGQQLGRIRKWGFIIGLQIGNYKGCQLLSTGSRVRYCLDACIADAWDVLQALVSFTETFINRAVVGFFLYDFSNTICFLI